MPILPQFMLHQENGAMIINTGSKQGITNPPFVAALFFLVSSESECSSSGNAAYNASKAAVKSLTEGLAHELRQQGNQNVTAHLFVYSLVSIILMH
jgi:NAD(P)-dependent dehydrogenase (short-subunit alcohol dehydrogenase family)